MQVTWGIHASDASDSSQFGPSSLGNDMLHDASCVSPLDSCFWGKGIGFVFACDQWEVQDPKKKWRYVSTICLAIFCGDIHLHRPSKKSLYMVGTSILGS